MSTLLRLSSAPNPPVPLIITKIAVGFVVGTLVGLTGMGGGILLLPLLMFGLGVSPIVAVGSDAVFNSFTKLGSGFLHWRQGTVNWHLVAGLITGSAPTDFNFNSEVSQMRRVPETKPEPVNAPH